MGRGKGKIVTLVTPSTRAKQILAFTPTVFTTFIDCDLGEERNSQAVWEHIEDVSDHSAIPWNVLPEFERIFLGHLQASAQNGEDVSYRLVELKLEGMEARSERGCSWTDPEKVREYVRRYNPPAVVFVEEDGEVALLDGSHRLQAAFARADRSIRAWVPRSLCVVA